MKRISDFCPGSDFPAPGTWQATVAHCRAAGWPTALLLLGLALILGGGAVAGEFRRHVIELAIPAPEDSAGGILVVDVDGDGRPDFLVTVPGHLAVHANNGQQLWVRKIDLVVGGSSEREGLPGHHGPGVAVGDIDGDGRSEVIFLTRDGVLHVVDGATGRPKATARPPVPQGAERWELAMVADFRGTAGDRDILLQATNQDGYRTGRYLAAYRAEDLLAGGEPLWTTDRFASCAHNGARLADITGDGRDEILGETIWSADGQLLVRATDYRGHMDAVFVANVRPDLPGLEVILLEEGSNYVQVLGATGLVWRKDFRGQEPQNAAVGRFRAGSDEIFIWCRSRYNQHQKPFVFDSNGEVVFDYAMDDVAPPGWTASGVEVIHTIDWTGLRQQLACAKERHTSGDVCLFEPLTGRFVQVFPEQADRLYVADVFGDWREEIIVLDGNRLHIYENTAANPRPDEPRLWEDRNYRRLKQTHNYYSP
jgi:hypothetical protein